jgi:hypothetical protein
MTDMSWSPKVSPVSDARASAVRTTTVPKQPTTTTPVTERRTARENQESALADIERFLPAM